MIERTNPDDIFMRGATLALMKYIEENIEFEQVENEKIVKYPIPVFYNKSQDSQFMRDYFTNYSTSCHNIEYADGDYDREPFAIVLMDSISIKMSDMTNKFVRGNHILTVQDENGYNVNKGYSSVLYVLPMDIKYSVEIRTEDTIQSFRVMQSILDGIFKNDVIHFDFRHQRIRCNLSLDASFTHDKKIDFTYTDDQSQKIKFTIDLECYYPVFDKTTTLFRGNVIRNFREFIDGKNEFLEKGTVTSVDGKMKVFQTTTLISEPEVKVLVKSGYKVSDTKDFVDKDTYKKKGPYIIGNREIILYKDTEEQESEENEESDN